MQNVGREEPEEAAWRTQLYFGCCSSNKTNEEMLKIPENMKDHGLKNIT